MVTLLLKDAENLNIGMSGRKSVSEKQLHRLRGGKPPDACWEGLSLKERSLGGWEEH